MRRIWSCGSSPRGWAMWHKPGPYLTYLLTMEVVALGVAAWAVAVSPRLTSLDWQRFGVLVLCTGLYLVWSHRQEQARRALKSVWAHVDFVGIWSTATLLVLPVPLMLAMIALMRLARWPAAGKRPYRFLFTTASIVVSAVVINLLMHELRWTGRSAVTVLESAPLLAALIGGALGYATIQAFVVGGASWLEGLVPAGQVLGTARENGLAAIGAVLGVLAAVTLVANPVAVLIIVGLAAAATKAAANAEDATFDARTGLLNSTAWLQQAGRAIAQAQRSGMPCSLLLVDADLFKAINDNYGHPAGDAVLRALGQVLRDEARRGDIVARYGGEEFAILLPDTDAEQAVVFAERVRHRAGHLAVVVRNLRDDEITLIGRETSPVLRDGQPVVDEQGQPIDADLRRISVSIGISTAGGNGLDLEALTVQADAALYHAKHAGRNRVSHHAAPASIVAG